MSDWISIDDELPDEDEVYLVCDGKYVNISEYSKDDEMFGGTNPEAIHFETITHWMELPPCQLINQEQ